MSIENVFLSYANQPLKKDVRSLRNIIAEIRNNIPLDLNEIDKVLSFIINLSPIEDPILFTSEIALIGSTNVYDNRFEWPLSQAVEAIAGDRETIYRMREHWMKRDRKMYRMEVDRFKCGAALIENNSGKCIKSLQQKCYVCHQDKFISLLREIVAGLEYTEIDDFERMTIWAADISGVKTMAIIEVGSKEHFAYRLKRKESMVLCYDEYVRGPLGNSYHPFNEFLFSIAVFSLMEFLLSNDRRKIKLCPYCQEFFIARDLKRKRSCYSKSCLQKAERDKKRHQRDIDPVKYV